MSNEPLSGSKRERADDSLDTPPVAPLLLRYRKIFRSLVLAFHAKTNVLMMFAESHEREKFPLPSLSYIDARRTGSGRKNSIDE